MAETVSMMLPLGTDLPPFTLNDAVSKKDLRSTDLRGPKGTLVMFICNHCPFVKHVMPELGRLDRDYTSMGVRFVAINSNDEVAHPEDGPAHMKELAEHEGWSFPFLMDGTQQVAQAFHAACTPDFFLFDKDGKLAYRGRLDETRPGAGKDAHGADLRAALDAVIAGTAPAGEQQPSVGCNIKWKNTTSPS